jgi:uncharacterized protein YjbI with pentapeptide repeats
MPASRRPKPPREPYPPDLADDAAPVLELGDLADVVVADQNWANQRAHRLSALRAEFRGCRLTGTDLAEATLRDITFDECRIDLVGLRHARLERVVFRDCRMSECDFYGSTLKDVLFERCELREATFSAATITSVELRGCDLAGLRGAEALRGARMPWNDVLGSAALFATALGIEIVVD